MTTLPGESLVHRHATQRLIPSKYSDDAGVRRLLDPDSYVQSQALAERRLVAGSLGIVNPSVRRPRGVCIACFRPDLVTNVRQGAKYQFRWAGSPQPIIKALSAR